MSLLGVHLTKGQPAQSSRTLGQELSLPGGMSDQGQPDLKKYHPLPLDASTEGMGIGDQWGHREVGDTSGQRSA